MTPAPKTAAQQLADLWATWPLPEQMQKPWVRDLQARARAEELATRKSLQLEVA